MGFFQLCERDPLVNMLRDVFGANVVRIPDDRIQPLAVLVHTKGKTFFRGGLAPLLTGNTPLEISPSSSNVADIAGKRSRQVSLDIGLYILGGFLGSLGISPADLAARLGNVAQIAVSFPSVTRLGVDINLLGRSLAGRAFDRTNPAAAIFFEEQEYELLVIDSILSSNRLNMRLTANHEGNLGVDINGLQQLLAGSNAKVSVGVTGDDELVFESDRALSFAFSCVRLFLDSEGRITALPPDLRARTLGSHGNPELVVRYSPDRVLLNPRPAMLSWDDWEGDQAAPRQRTPLGTYLSRWRTRTI